MYENEDLVPLETPETELKVQKKNIFMILLLVFILLFPTIPYMFYRYAVSNFSYLNEETKFEIKQGEGVTTIAENLKDARLINSPLLFKIYIKLNSLDSSIQAGSYVIPPMTPIVDLVEILQHGRNDVTITYLEGWRVEQLALILSEKLDNFDYKTFVDLAKDYEGQLFPDTYMFKQNASEKEVFNILRETFDRKTTNLLIDENLNSAGITKKEALILASIVEREIHKENDKKLIAGILIKRIREGMRLEVDASTQYTVALLKHCQPEDYCRSEDADCEIDQATEMCLSGQYPEYLEDINWWPKVLTYNDLNFNDAYNTRKNYGMPPTPISSFSLSSLEAVIFSEPSNFYFYLHDSTGKTHFSVDYAEHLQKANQYLN